MNSIDINKTSLGIELGSTRIKAVLIDENGSVLANGSFEWENSFIDGYWTYSIDEVWHGIQKCYASLKQSVQEMFSIKLTTIGAIGISGMMHGYMPFDSEDNLLVPFRTWRNNNAESAAKRLTNLLGYPIPARWSIAHLYQAIINKEKHIKSIVHIDTLAIYVHYMLTGERVVGVGEASGMFPISPLRQYDEGMIGKVNQAFASEGVDLDVAVVLPNIRVAGESAGVLTRQGALLLDTEGDLVAGIPFCPPEGDAGTGMVATNTVRAGTGNISAGTSIFGMIVLDKPLQNVHSEIDLVTTPSGDYVAMVHCNNCSSEINAWASLFEEVQLLSSNKVDKNKLFTQLFNAAKHGEVDCGNLLYYNYTSGENITGIENPCPLMLRTAESRFNLANFMRMQIYSAFATLRIGMDILTQKEKVQVESVLAHGGIFKTKGVAQQFLASAINTAVAVNETASEGGAYGMALLAQYSVLGKGKSLADFLAEVFKGNNLVCKPIEEETAGFNRFLDRYKSALPAVALATNSLLYKDTL